VQETFTQDADLPRKKAIELPDSSNFLLEDFSRHIFISLFDKSNYLFAIIK
jgi:hypothetical protein